VTEEDDHYFVVDGRRWRRTDPAIPEEFRVELVAELMDARRAIGGGDRSPAARARVNDAKVALGERGEPWWSEPSEEGLCARIGATIRALLRHRSGKSICPSDVARTIGGTTWRNLMDESAPSPPRSQPSAVSPSDRRANPSIRPPPRAPSATSWRTDRSQSGR
jgi:hypothetical protein